MKTSLQDGEELATLEELFEFIDCCHATLPLELVTSKAPPQRSQSIDQIESDMQSKPKRRRKRTSWSSSTGLQRRKRAELQFLREHVQDLETYAEKLKKRARQMKEELKFENEWSCNWQEIAVAEYVERQKAEETNRTLRKTMDSLLQVSATLRLIAEQKSLR